MGRNVEVVHQIGKELFHFWEVTFADAFRSIYNDAHV